MIFLLLFKYSCLHFPHTTLPHPSHPQFYPPLVLSIGPLYLFLDDPSASFPHFLPPPYPLVTVSLFFISMSLVLFCLLVCFVDELPLIGEITWYLSFTAWLISLSIMLSSSIYVLKLSLFFIKMKHVYYHVMLYMYIYNIYC